MTDYVTAKNKLEEKGFFITLKKNNLNDFISHFKNDNVEICLKVQLGGYILSADIKDNNTAITLKDSEISLIFKII